MDSYLLLKLIHILSAVVITGTGAGIAFFMFMAKPIKQPAGDLYNNKTCCPRRLDFHCTRCSHTTDHRNHADEKNSTIHFHPNGLFG